MDDQKEASCSWLLFQARKHITSKTAGLNAKAVAQKADELEKENEANGRDPEQGMDVTIPYWQACK
jgi:hypothetical protein